MIKILFAERLRQLRRERNLTQKQLGKELGWRESAISMMENGNRGTTIEKLAALAEYFHVSTDYLLGITTDPAWVGGPRVAFVSLGCAKNVVNCEQMMALCREAGFTLQEDLPSAAVAVINTCGFIDSAKEEAIAHIFRAVQMKDQGLVGKILVTGCLSQRYAEEIRREIPEVDGLLGTGSFKDIVPAIREVLAGGSPWLFGDINAPVDELPRVLTTPKYYAYIRIAEGCANWCAYCIIPKLRGRYRSRPMDKVLAEAAELAARGVGELIVVAQDVTRYGMDWDGQHHLSQLLHELCKLDFHTIRLHYLYPDQIDDELIETIASEPKIAKYMDIPLQHCNDEILRGMNRKGTKAEILALLEKIRQRIPHVVLRTSLITGLPGEGEAEFEELCDFLRQTQIERAGVFPYSPEEGTPAAKMTDRVDTEEAVRRAELLEEIQSRIIDAYNEKMQGCPLAVLCEGQEGPWLVGRSYGESPDIDGRIYFTGSAVPGDLVTVRITGAMDGELVGEQMDGLADAPDLIPLEDET